MAKTIVRQISDELFETGKEIVKESAHQVKEAVKAVTNVPEVTPQNVNKIREKDDKERGKQIAYFRRVLAENQFHEAEKPPVEKPVRKKVLETHRPPAGISHRPGLVKKRPQTSSVEQRDFKIG